MIRRIREPQDWPTGRPSHCDFAGKCPDEDLDHGDGRACLIPREPTHRSPSTGALIFAPAKRLKDVVVLALQHRLIPLRASAGG